MQLQEESSKRKAASSPLPVKAGGQCGRWESLAPRLLYHCQRQLMPSLWVGLPELVRRIATDQPTLPHSPRSVNKKAADRIPHPATWHTVTVNLTRVPKTHMLCSTSVTPLP